MSFRFVDRQQSAAASISYEYSTYDNKIPFFDFASRTFETMVMDLAGAFACRVNVQRQCEEKPKILVLLLTFSICFQVVVAFTSSGHLPSRKVRFDVLDRRVRPQRQLLFEPWSAFTRTISRIRSSTDPVSSELRPRSDFDEVRQAAQATDRNENLRPPNMTLEFQLLSSIGSVPPETWDACLTNHSSPFLEHSWLRCLEESKCASPTTGWMPQHICIRIDGKIRGFVPLYLKGHSMGEFIFDQQFAEAAYQNGIDYYPKMLVGVPFTPATGHRILWHPNVYKNRSTSEIRQLRRAVGLFLRKIAEAKGLSSVHCNFLTDEEATDLSEPLQYESDRSVDIKTQIQSLLGRLSIKDEYLRRTSLQYHWINENPQTSQPFTSFDEYLACFKSKRRITIKRERCKVLKEEGIRVDAVRGRDILQHKGLVKRMFEIYLSTIDKLVWGRQYLTLDFFERLAASDFVDNLCFLCARRVDSDCILADDVFAGTFNVIKDGVFYGRYWGCLPGHEVKNLHFEVCYWSAIDYCIKNGLKRMEPGAGGGEYKWARGFDPALIHSVHYICHPGLRRAIAQFLGYETESNVELTEYLRQKSAIASKNC